MCEHGTAEIFQRAHANTWGYLGAQLNRKFRNTIPAEFPTSSTFPEMLLLKDFFNISALIYLHSPIPHNCLVMIHSAFPTFHQSYQPRVQLHFKQRFAQRAPNFSAPEGRMCPPCTFHSCCKVIRSRGAASLTKKGKKIKNPGCPGTRPLVFSTVTESDIYVMSV